MWHSDDAGSRVGTVTGLWRYPVKSMAGEALASADVSWAGLSGDRRWAFIRADSDLHGFPWHTIRENPAMGTYVPRLTDPGRPDKSSVEVATPAGRSYPVNSPALAAELGTGLRLVRLYRGTFDAMPVSLISTVTVAALCARGGVTANELRFRPNLVVTTACGAAFAEDDWVGCLLRIGGATVRIDRRDSRCVVINVDPGTGAPGGSVLKAIGADRRACAGVYGSTVTPGLVRLGDDVTVAAREMAGSEAGGRSRSA